MMILNFPEEIQDIASFLMQKEVRIQYIQELKTAYRELALTEKALKEGRVIKRSLGEKSDLAHVLSGTTNIYFIFCEDLNAVKIGRAKDLRQRLSNLQIGSPAELRLIGSFKGHMTLEKYLHKVLAASHIRGEWFRPDKLLLDYAEAANDGGLSAVLELALLQEKIGQAS